MHCAVNTLNLVLSDSLNVPAVRNCLGVVGEVTNLLRNNALANDLLKDEITRLTKKNPSRRFVSKSQSLKVSKLESLQVFYEEKVAETTIENGYIFKAPGGQKSSIGCGSFNLDSNEGFQLPTQNQ